MKYFFNRVLVVRVWHSFVIAFLLSLSIAGLAVFGLVGLHQISEFSKTNRQLAQANKRSIANVKRIQRLETPPTDEQLARAASHALQVCVADPKCRAQLRGSIRKTNLKPSDVPGLSQEPPSSGSGGTSGGDSGSSGGSGNSGGSSPAPAPTPTPTPTPRRPSPAPRPAPTPTPPPVSRPPATQPNPPTTTARPPVTPPTVSVPPITPPTTPTVPPVTVPPVRPPVVPPIRICTDVIKVNCVDPKSGRVVGPEGHAADPNSNSGRGNQDDPLCERIKAVCPPGIIQFG